MHNNSSLIEGIFVFSIILEKADIRWLEDFEKTFLVMKVIVWGKYKKDSEENIFNQRL